MISSGSCNSWFFNRGNSTIDVGNQLSVQVEGTRVCKGSRSRGSSISSNRSSNNSSSHGRKMISSGSCNSWVFNRGNSTIDVGNQLSVQIEGTRVCKESTSWGSSISSNRSSNNSSSHGRKMI